MRFVASRKVPPKRQFRERPPFRPVPLKEFVLYTVNPFVAKPWLDRCDQIDAILKSLALSPALGLAANAQFTQRPIV